VLVVIGAGMFVGALVAIWATARHMRTRADSLRRYSRAVTALRSIAEEPRPEARADLRANDRGLDGRPNVRVLDEVAPTRHLHDRRTRAGRRASRPDPESVARRPVIAHLPSTPRSAPLGGDPGRQAG
jgi:hypothetical protein